METCPSFSQFLQEAAVLSQRQAEKLTPSLANEDEDQSIFKLADFFRTLTPSDCYDLALRLYLLWKKASQVSQVPIEKKESKESVNIPETPSDLHQKKKTFKNNMKSVTQLPTEKYDTFASESETISTTNYASPTRKNLFDYLHSESHRKNYTKLENEQRKMENEMKGCSFQPNTLKYHSARSPSEVFDRLQQDLRKEKNEMNESKKLEIEMRDCTFTPALVSKRLTTEDVSMYSSRSSMNQTFDRLYKDHQIKKHHSIENELKKQELEVKGCTFQPALSSRNRSPSQHGNGGDYTDRFNQLYKLHSERQRSLMKKRIEKSEEEEKKYAFKPAIKASPAKRSNSKGVQERLLEWNEKKNQKLEIKKQEKIIAEKSMNRELNLPARRESDVVSPVGGQAFERLYQDSEMKKVRKEILEKRVMKDVGASFTPKTNLSRNTSAKKPQKENISTGYFGGIDTNLNVSRDGEGFSKQRSPAMKKHVEEQKAWNNALYRKHFLDDIQNNMGMDPDGKTATFGAHY